jgi:hypothetical protein
MRMRYELAGIFYELEEYRTRTTAQIDAPIVAKKQLGRGN